jgi:phage shock protein A
MGMRDRVVRIWKADVHGVMDQFEDKGLLLKQSLRDMEDELEKKEQHLKQLEINHLKVIQEKKKYLAEQERIEPELSMAVAGNKDDIARMLLRKSAFLKRHLSELENHEQAMLKKINETRQWNEARNLQYEQLKLKAREYFMKIKTDQQDDFFPPPHGIYKNNNGSKYSFDPDDHEIELELNKRKEAYKQKAGEGKNE